MTMTDEEIIDARKRGWTIAEIISEGAAEKRVYSVLRSAGLCRDQRPETRYRVTLMVPETIEVDAQSPAIAKKLAKEAWGDESVTVAGVEAAV